MKNLYYYLLLALLCLMSSVSRGQFTRQQADNLVLNQILLNQLSSVDVYVYNNFKTPQTPLTLYDNRTIAIPYSESWAYFVDDLPFAKWEHPVRYILVNKANGSYTIAPDNWLPSELATSCTAISLIPRPSQSILPSGDNSLAYTPLPPNTHRYAVIINGDDGVDLGGNLYIRYWNNTSAIYNTLLQVYGFTKENIFVHYAEGYSNQENKDDLDGLPLSDDIDYDAYWATIDTTFRELAGKQNNKPEIPKLTTDDELFVFVTDHGGHNTLPIERSYIKLNPATHNGGEKLFDNELATMVKDIECAQMIFVMGQCYSGGFIDDLVTAQINPAKCLNRAIYTACKFNQESWNEVWITGGKYDEFVYYWMAAVRGNYPNTDAPWIPWHATGSFPFTSVTGFQLHPTDYSPDDPLHGGNNDGYIQLGEAFQYANDFDTWTDYGYTQRVHNFGVYDADNAKNIGFTTDLLTVAGYAGKINTNEVSEPRNYVAGGTITVESPGSLTLKTNTRLNLGEGSNKLLVQSGAGLVLQNNVKLLGNSGNYVEVNGNITFGQGLLCENTTTTNSTFGGLKLLNNGISATLNSANFNKTSLISYADNLSIVSSNFNQSQINTYRGNITCSNTTLASTPVNFTNYSPGTISSVNVNNSTFLNLNTGTGLIIYNYPNFNVNTNDIKSNGVGLMIYNSGSGTAGNQKILNNHIHDCSSIGILSYNTTATIENNNIHNNQMGIKLMSNSTTSLKGNPAAANKQQTQQIRDNSSYEVYASQYCFPNYFKNNIVIDDDNLGNPTDPMIFHDRPNVQPYLYLDVTSNCWGTGFSNSQDLKTTNGTFNYLPIWCPPGGGYKSGNTDDIFLVAESQFENGNFTEAKILFESLIEQYPKSFFAGESMKELMRIVEPTNGDYNSLKEYYLTNDSIVADTVLRLLGENLSNKCDEKLGNWSQAIDWYENRILNPISFEDSVFSIIDLGNLYLLLENQGYKSNFSGKLSQFKPASTEEFSEQRDYLLSLIPSENKTIYPNTILAQLSPGELLQNMPNPFSQTTTIWYRTNKKGNAEIVIVDLLGKEIIRINDGQQEEGFHKITISNPCLPHGTYFYTLILNGIISDTKKMVIIK